MFKLFLWDKVSKLKKNNSNYKSETYQKVNRVYNLIKFEKFRQDKKI